MLFLDHVTSSLLICIGIDVLVCQAQDTNWYPVRAQSLKLRSVLLKLYES
jgi:hypothetical protein